MNEQIARVALPGLRRTLSYSFGHLPDPLPLGVEVSVPLGKREASGWVVGFGGDDFTNLPGEERQAALFDFTAEKRKLKEIRSFAPAFLPDQIPLFEWMSAYYGVPMAEVLENALPSREELKFEEYFRLPSRIAALWKDNPKLIDEKFRRSKQQRAVLKYLLEAGEPVLRSELREKVGELKNVIASLEEKGCLERLQSQSTWTFPNKAQTEKDDHHALTPGQTEAVETIFSALNEAKFAPLLLFGVTGSGKTEVYLRAIKKVLAEGAGALVVVPEISLTPQLYDQFERRLGEPIALLHSEVGRRSRWQSWQGLLQGDLRVAIGARSAVFAPVRNLRLIIVDEEHESSYKQSDGLRYHARDVAIMRAKLLDAVSVLGSATPSFETLVNVSQKRYRVINMPDRVRDRSLPSIEVVDLNKIKKREMPSLNFSPQLYDAIKDALARGGQAVVLFNRRGFSSYLQCETCNEVVLCPNCSIAMTYHKKKHRLLCHYCNESTSPPKYCRFCRDPRITAMENEDAEGKKKSKFGELAERGSGTERVVEEVAELFPGSVIERMDRDTVGKKDSYRQILGRMRSGEANILVGTQMIAKGHDLPGVTVVGILDADIGLHAPDFRSSEKTYQLITQASGRAGRGTEPGRVIIQTRQPNHPTIVATQTGRFKAFARYELDYRKQLNYPPWGRLMRLVVSSPVSEDAYLASLDVRQAVNDLIAGFGDEEGLRVLGPSPAPHERLRGRYRWHILIKSKSAATLSRLADALDRWKSEVKGFADFRLVVDIDPVDML